MEGVTSGGKGPVDLGNREKEIKTLFSWTCLGSSMVGQVSKGPASVWKGG